MSIMGASLSNIEDLSVTTATSSLSSPSSPVVAVPLSLVEGASVAPDVAAPVVSCKVGVEAVAVDSVVAEALLEDESLVSPFPTPIPPSMEADNV